MVKVEKPYVFQSLDGKKVSLADLFGPHEQLIVYHFMFGPKAEVGCPGCTFVGSNMADHRLLATTNTAFACISRGDPAKIAAYREKNEWTFPWYSSLGSDFNFDFHVSADESVAPVQWNYKDKEELIKRGQSYAVSGELPGISVFYKEGNDVYHTYSSFARGVEKLINTYMMLDLTPLGRQDFKPHNFPRPYELGEVQA